MTRSERFKPVVGVSASREQEAAKAFADQQRVLEQERHRLADLEKFRQEYWRDFERRGADGISGVRLRQWQLFMANLDQAIAHQLKVIAAAERQSEQKRQLWLEARSRRKAVDKVVERYRSEEQKAEAKREQKQQDDLAQRKGKPEY